tara:strand:- start:269 stop:1201 length:933 start_codon:yes stop_codon:yes gene_type:complete
MLGKVKAKGTGAVYLRVSTTEQELKGQKGAVGDWAARQKGLTLKREYAEKISGGGGYVRKELNAMLADARANQFTVAIFNDMSRLGRNVHEAMKIVHEFADCGVAVAICDIDMVWDLDDPVCNLVAGTLAAVAQFESDEGKKRTRRGMVGKAKQIASNIKAGKLPPGTRIGMPSIIEKYVKDPNGREHKKGLLVAPDPTLEALFEAIWMDEENKDAYRTISQLLRIPLNPKCKYGCHLSRPSVRATPDRRVVRTLEAKCRCGLKPSTKTIHKTRVKLGLPVRCAHSFKRKTVKEGEHDIMLADYLSASEA